MAKAGHSGIFEAAPNSQSIQFGGQFINGSALARQMGLSVSAISKKLAGKRPITMVEANRMATLLDMTIEEFNDALLERIPLAGVPPYTLSECA